MGNDYLFFSSYPWVFKIGMARMIADRQQEKRAIQEELEGEETENNDKVNNL